MRQRYFPLIIVLLGIILYANTFSVPLAFDDEHYVSANPAIGDFRYFYSPSLVKQAITQLKLDPNFVTRKVVYFTFAVNHWLNGDQLTGYHLVNLIIHLLNGLLLYGLVLLTLRTPFFRNRREEMRPVPEHIPAFLTAVFFVAHPVQTEAVTYLCQRFTLMAAMLYLLSLVLYAGWRLSEVNPVSSPPGKSPRGTLLYLATLTVVSAAMFTKEIAFTLPVMMVVYEWMFFGRPSLSRLKLLLPFLATMLIIPFLISGGAEYEDVARLSSVLTKPGSDNPALSYFFTQLRVIVTYIRLLLLPVAQNLDYDYPLYTSFRQTPVILSGIFLSTLAGLAAYLFHRSARPTPNSYWQRLISFGIVWFFVTLSVESSLMPLNDVIFEHRLYLPSVGFIISILGFVALTGMKFPRQGRLLVPVFLLALGALSVATYQRNTVWHDPITLWEDASRKSPSKARPKIQLANQYFNTGRLEEATGLLEEVLRLPSPPIEKIPAYSTLELIYTQLQDESALQRTYLALLPVMREAGASQKDNVALAMLYNNMATIYTRLGRYPEAEEVLDKAIALRGEIAMFHNTRGVLHLLEKRPDEALLSFQEAIRRDPDNPESYSMLGKTLLAKGNDEKAVVALLRALELDPHREDTYSTIVTLASRMTNKAAADKVLDRLREIKGNDVRQRIGWQG